MPKLISKRQPADEDTKWLYRAAIVFAAASILVTGYRVYFHNQALQIPLVRLLNNPSLYPNDPFAATLPYYASFVWRIVAWAERAVPLESVLLVLFLTSRFILIYSAGNLALAFAPKSRLAAAGAMAFLAIDPTPIIGGGTLLMPYFEQTSLAVGFLVLAMAAFYRRRRLPWALWLAIGFACNSMYGCYALTYFGAMFLLSPRYRREWKRWLTPVALFLALVAPVIALSAGVIGKGGVDLQLWLAACRARVPHHIFPSTWPWIKFARFGLLMIAAPATVALGLREVRRLHAAHIADDQLTLAEAQTRDLKSATLLWTGVGAAWLAAAIVAEKLGSPTLLMLQPARATDLWYVFAVTAAIAVCSTNLHRPLVLLSCITTFALFDPTSRTALVPLAIVLLGRFCIGRDKRLCAVAIVVVLAGVLSFAIRADRNGIPAACVAKPPDSMQHVCEWARTNTGRNAIFLVNPTWGEFRGLSERPAFVTWKDGSALLWHRPFAVPWSQRIRALGYDVATGQLPARDIDRYLDRIYERLTDREARRLATRYGIDYWVVSAEHRSRLPVCYSCGYSKVLKLR